MFYWNKKHILPSDATHNPSPYISAILPSNPDTHPRRSSEFISGIRVNHILTSFCYNHGDPIRQKFQSLRVGNIYARQVLLHNYRFDISVPSIILLGLQLNGVPRRQAIDFGSFSQLCLESQDTVFQTPGGGGIILAIVHKA